MLLKKKKGGSCSGEKGKVAPVLKKKKVALVLLKKKVALVLLKKRKVPLTQTMMVI